MLDISSTGMYRFIKVYWFTAIKTFKKKKRQIHAVLIGTMKSTKIHTPKWNMESLIINIESINN